MSILHAPGDCPICERIRQQQPNVDRKRVELFQTRMDACDTLLDYLHDDVPWKDQQPMMDMLRQLRRDFKDQLFEWTKPGSPQI